MINKASHLHLHNVAFRGNFNGCWGRGLGASRFAAVPLGHAARFAILQDHGVGDWVGVSNWMEDFRKLPSMKLTVCP